MDRGCLCLFNMPSAAFAQTAVASVHSRTPDILGTTGKTNLNQAYKNILMQKAMGKAARCFII